MGQVNLKAMRRSRRRRGLRVRIQGTPQRPRLSVFRSHKHIYAQIIDDLGGHTLAAASTAEKALGVAAGGNRQGAVAVGKILGQRATEAGISAVVFDRGGYRYHGRVKSLADAAREAGLKF